MIGPVDTIDPLAFRMEFISPDDGASMHCSLPHRFRPASVIRLRQFLLATALLTAVVIESALSAVPVGPVLRVTLHDGSSLRTHIETTPLATEDSRTAVSLLADDVRLSEVERIDFPRQVFDWLSGRPVRIVTLWTGESFASGPYRIANDSPADSADGNGRPLTGRLGLSGLQYPVLSREVPIDCVASICPPWQARDLASMAYTVTVPGTDGTLAEQHLMPGMQWSFEPRGDPLKPGCRATTTLPEPAATVLVSLDIRADSPRSSAPIVESVQFLLEETGHGVRHISVNIRRLANDRIEYVLNSDIPMSISAVRTKHHVFRLSLFLDQALTVGVNGQLLGSTPRWSGTLKALRVVSPMMTPVAENLLPPARFRVRRQATETRRSPRSHTLVRDSDCIVLNNGDELFGHSAHEESWRSPFGDRVQREVLSLTTVSGPVHIPWPNVEAVQFRHSPVPIVNDMATNRLPQVGWLAEITLAPEASCVHFGEAHGGRLRTVIVGAGAAGLLVDHPLLRTLKLPWGMLQRIEPLAFGSVQMLDAGPRHLGNGIREEFSSLEPVGTEWSLSWVRVEARDRPVYLSLDAAELIPSGSQTLAVSPRLNAVRGGFLATRVEVNGQVIGTLNEHVSIHCPAHAPRRMRIRIPAAVLKQGVNTLRFRQTPAPDDPTSFDDCEIRAIAIEEDHAPPNRAG